MLEINVFSITYSKVFSVTIRYNFLFAIVVGRFYDCKHIIEKQTMQLRNTRVNIANWGILHIN
jgi:hypothetical protein